MKNSGIPIVKLDRQGLIKEVTDLGARIHIKSESMRMVLDGKESPSLLVANDPIVKEGEIIGTKFSFLSIQVDRIVTEHEIHPAPEIDLSISNSDSVPHEVVVHWSVSTEDPYALISHTNSLQFRDGSAVIDVITPFGKSRDECAYLPIYVCMKHKPRELFRIPRPNNISSDVTIETELNQDIDDELSIKFNCGVVAPRSCAKVRFVLWISRSLCDTLGFSGVAFIIDPVFEDAVSSIACRIGVLRNGHFLNLHRFYTPVFWTKRGKLTDEAVTLIKQMPIRALVFLTASPPNQCFSSERAFLDIISSTEIRHVLSKAELSSKLTSIMPTFDFQTIEKEYGDLVIDLQLNVDRLFGIKFKPSSVLLVQNNPQIVLAAAYYAKKYGCQLCVMNDNAIGILTRLSPQYVEIWSEYNVDTRKIETSLREKQINLRNIRGRNADAVCIELAANFLNYYVPARIMTRTRIDPRDPMLFLFYRDSGAKMPLGEFWQSISLSQIMKYGFPSVNGPPLMLMTTFSRANWTTAISAATYADAKNAILTIIHESPSRGKNSKYDISWGDGLMKDLENLDAAHANATCNFTQLQRLTALSAWLHASNEDKNEGLSWIKKYAPDLLNQPLKTVENLFLNRNMCYKECTKSRRILRGAMKRFAKRLRSVIPEPVEYLVEIINPANILFFSSDPRIPYELMNKEDRFGDLHTWASRFSVGRITSIDPQEMAALTSFYIIRSTCNIEVNQARSLLLVADPTGDLPGSRLEGELMFSDMGKDFVIFRIGAQARKREVLKRIGQYDLMHFSCHTVQDASSRLGLLLRKGKFLRKRETLRSKDIPMLTRRPLVFVNSCSGSIVRDLVGGSDLASSFISKGASAYVGPLLVINDVLATTVALSFYSSVIDLPLGYSLNSAVRESLIKLDYLDYTAATYMLYGDPTLSIRESNTIAIEAEHYRNIGEEAANRLDYRLAVKAFVTASAAYLRLAEMRKMRALESLSNEERSFFMMQCNGDLAYALRCKSNAYSIYPNMMETRDQMSAIVSWYGISAALLRKAVELTHLRYNKLKWTAGLLQTEGKFHYCKGFIEMETKDGQAARDEFLRAVNLFKSAMPLLDKLGVSLHTQSMIARIMDAQACALWAEGGKEKMQQARQLFVRALKAMPPFPLSFEGTLIRNNLKLLDTELLEKDRNTASK